MSAHKHPVSCSECACPGVSTLLSDGKTWVTDWQWKFCEPYRIQAEMYEAICRQYLTQKQITEARDKWELGRL